MLVKYGIMEKKGFWETKRLEDLSQREWELVCDGCGWCCLCIMEIEETGEYQFTSVACKQLDGDTCRCKNYVNRSQIVPYCVELDFEIIHKFHWLPDHCAYMRLSKGLPLPDWHHLVSGDPNKVHESGISILQKTISEDLIPEDELGDYLI